MATLTAGLKEPPSLPPVLMQAKRVSTIARAPAIPSADGLVRMPLTMRMTLTKTAVRIASLTSTWKSRLKTPSSWPSQTETAGHSRLAGCYGHSLATLASGMVPKLPSKSVTSVSPMAKNAPQSWARITTPSHFKFSLNLASLI